MKSKDPFKIEVAPCELDKLNEGPFLQTAFWARFKSLHGWSGLGFSVNAEADGFSETTKLLVLLRHLGRGMTLAYIPHGPYGKHFLKSEGVQERLFALGQRLRSYLPTSTIALRFDLLSGTRFQPLRSDSEEDDAPPVEEPFPTPLQRPLFKPAADVQPPDTVILDLSGSEEEILGRMKKKTRYNIRLAEKKGVMVTVGGLSDLDAWYELYRETSLRDRIALHGADYYRDLFRLAEEDEKGGKSSPRFRLLLARFDGELLAGNVVLLHGDQGVYLYGASSNAHRNLMAPYALQWEGIRLAKAAGCLSYDLFGIPPNNDSSHPMHGLYRFKTGFGGYIEHRHGAWDLRFKPFFWSVFNTVDKLRVWYFKKWKKR